jgi:hypothetical protein
MALGLNNTHQPLTTQSSLESGAKIVTTQEELQIRGAVFTRPEVVNFILDLAGYTKDRPLHKKRLLEPSFGYGNFLFPIVERLLFAWRAAKGSKSALDDLSNAIRSVELHNETFDFTRSALIDLLKQEGFTINVAIKLADQWLIKADFLLTPMDGQFNFVVGNPPYVRQELIPASLLRKYRNLYQTMYDRADLYVPFIERSLSLLDNSGNLGFICADRWMKNQYGGPLRAFIAKQFHLKIYVDMVDTPAFHSNVIAYPAITIISREISDVTRIARRPVVNQAALAMLADTLCTKHLPNKIESAVHEQAVVTQGMGPWLLESARQTRLVQRLEKQFPTIEEAACKVSIGVATGADKVFIRNFNELNVEPDRKLRLATTRDILSGEVKWSGLGIINPFLDTGGLVNLSDYPRLRSYLEAQKTILVNRHCAKKTPENWYRTIDRIHTAIMKAPKLLIPDIKGEAHVVFEAGELYPHHNLYYITSKVWDLRALQAVLLSDVARLFIATYSTKMRGGYYRFQAQYLRRIRIPQWSDVSPALQIELIEAAKQRDIQACNRSVFKLYKLNKMEILTLKDGV